MTMADDGWAELKRTDPETYDALLYGLCVGCGRARRVGHRLTYRDGQQIDEMFVDCWTGQACRESGLIQALGWA